MTSSSHDPAPSTVTDNPYRVLPSISVVLDALADVPVSSSVRLRIVRSELDRIRMEIGTGAQFTSQQIVDRCRSAIDTLSHTRLDEVINGTGIILHTNLGRAPVSEATAAAMARAAGSYLSLEIDPETNRRGGRMTEIGRLMHVLTGAEATSVVNNNAAAVLLTLAALCSGREVIVSRGEAVEIGGGFRIPDVVSQSGCRLVEVGTTNRTYASDYANAVTDSTGGLLRVHPSNFQIEGFVSSPTSSELAEVASNHGTILIDDLGSGALIDTSSVGLRSEPTIAEALEVGAAIVTFSGDKLLGGPQAGMICGRSDLVARIERHPLARAVRADKTTLAGVAATLRHYVAGDDPTSIPIWKMLRTPVEELRNRAEAICVGMKVSIVNSTSSIGGGSLPGETLPSVAIAFVASNADDLARRLRTGSPRVFPIIRDGSVRIDMRTVLPHQDIGLGAGNSPDARVIATETSSAFSS